MATAPKWALPADVAARAVQCLDDASAHTVGTQAADGSWYKLSEPRILENAVVALSLAGIEQAQAARARAVRWLGSAVPQQHDPLVAAADRWLLDLCTLPEAPALANLSAHDGPHSRRALYLHALACAAGVPGADADRLLSSARAALGSDRGQRVKPWQRILLLAFEAIACSALDEPLPADTVGDLGRAQSADGSFYGMPLVTGILHLTLARVAPGHEMTWRCRDNLLASQQADGTWRFAISEVWDTGLMVRAFRGHPGFEAAALDGALELLSSTQNEDGGWSCTAPLDSDNDTTGNTLLALAGTPWIDRVRAAAGGYARRNQTPQGLWTTWLSSDDTPVPDVVAHMAAGIAAAGLTEVDLGPARKWLAELGARGRWESDWYIPPAYSAAEIAPAVGSLPHSRSALAELLQTQRADGGWPRIPDEPYSSPTATGLALTALAAGGPAVPDQAVEAAVRFLIDTQRGDGTWSDLPVMYGPRPFLTVTATHVHALASRGLRDVLLATHDLWAAHDATGARR
ncbi:prenyltransferase/squalene oxidase repeat-containing protein [Streptomyces sp. NPDC059982]|uniref:prenyltransferase/squalene oxidase repeat-containing protein n=1 Tax=unclassified Streptomyces TaxID=2593676 RepID=UPI0036B3365A